MKGKTITICSSGSFYKDVLEIEMRLKELGFQIKIPKTANIMKRTGNFNISHYKTWFEDPSHYKIKTKLMDEHFKKVLESDAILVVNNKKNGLSGYIGGNVLMEMTLAYHYKKPIFLLNPIDDKSNIKEEILGMNAIVIGNDLQKIKL